MEILDFYADWCGPCRMMKPVLEEFKQAHPEIRVEPINVDEKTDLVEQYRVSSIPCLVFLENGEEIERLVGVQSLRKIEKTVSKEQ